MRRWKCSLLRGKRLGLALSEIKSLVDMYESPKDTVAQTERFLGVLTHQRATLEQRNSSVPLSPWRRRRRHPRAGGTPSATPNSRT